VFRVEDNLIADATSVLMAYMRGNQIRPDFRYGQLALGLEIVSLIRTLEHFPVVNVQEKEGTIATLHTLLREQGLENAYEVYDELAEWRRVKFVRAASLRANGGVSVRRHVDRLSSSSVHDAPDRRIALRDKSRELPSGRPNRERDSLPIPGQLVLPVEEGQETLSE
jgi:hypothetical protein